MATKEKTYSYSRGLDAAADQDFMQGAAYGRVKLGRKYIFWKKGFRWYTVEITHVQRAYRRVEAVDTKMCCGNVNFDIQKLMLCLDDGAVLELLIGEGTLREAEGLYRDLQAAHPEIEYGKPQENNQKQ